MVKKVLYQQNIFETVFHFLPPCSSSGAGVKLPLPAVHPGAAAIVLPFSALHFVYDIIVDTGTQIILVWCVVLREI